VIATVTGSAGYCSVGYQSQAQRDIVASVLVVLLVSCGLGCACVFVILAVFSCDKMVAQIKDIMAKYEERVWSMENVPRCSYGRRMLRSDGGPNRSF
jgi:hypothetical protein